MQVWPSISRTRSTCVYKRVGINIDFRTRSSFDVLLLRRDTCAFCITIKSVSLGPPVSGTVIGALHLPNTGNGSLDMYVVATRRGESRGISPSNSVTTARSGLLHQGVHR